MAVEIIIQQPVPKDMKLYAAHAKRFCISNFSYLIVCYLRTVNDRCGPGAENLQTAITVQNDGRIFINTFALIVRIVRNSRN